MSLTRRSRSSPNLPSGAEDEHWNTDVYEPLDDDEYSSQDDSEDDLDDEPEAETEDDEGDDFSLRTSLFAMPSGHGSDHVPTKSGASTTSDKQEDMSFSLKPRDFWSRQYVGLYCNYAAVGLLSGIVGNPSEDACNKEDYFTYGNLKKDDPALRSLCNNIYNISFLPWNFKLFLAIVCDLIRPFGMRVKPYIVIGWFCVLIGLFAVGFNLRSLTHEQYLYSMVAIMSFALVATVPADGYAVQLAVMSKPNSVMRKGSVLVTCYMVRFFSAGLGSFIHAFLMNGPDQNGDKEIAWDQAWDWGISFQAYFFIITAALVGLFIPMLMMKEVVDDRPESKRRSFFGLMRELWDMLQRKATLRVLLFGFFIQMSLMSNSASYYVQQVVISVPTLQTGVQAMGQYIGRGLGVLAFRSQLMHQDWRKINVFVRVYDICSKATLLCIAFYNIFGLQNGWFTVYTNITSTFLRGIVFMALPVAIIEIARPGMEATTFQLFGWAYNSSIDVANQMRRVLFDSLVPADLSLTPVKEFDADNGPWIFTRYTIILSAIQICTALIACRFMPASAVMARQWMTSSNYKFRWLSLVMMTVIAVYSALANLSSLFPDMLACLVWLGGDGCDNVNNSTDR